MHRGAVARMGGHWAQQPPSREVPGRAACWWHWGRQCRQESPRPEQQTCAAGCCRQGFPEAHVTPGSAPGTDEEGWPWSAQGAWLCSPPAAETKKLARTWLYSPLAHTTSTETPALPSKHWASQLTTISPLDHPSLSSYCRAIEATTRPPPQQGVAPLQAWPWAGAAQGRWHSTQDNPVSPRTAPPHILPPARGRGPCQPNTAGLRQQTHPEVHRGGQGHGGESGEDKPPQPQDRDRHISWYLTSASPLPPRTSARHCPHSAAPRCCLWWTSTSSSGNPNR